MYGALKFHTFILKYLKYIKKGRTEINCFSFEGNARNLRFGSVNGVRRYEHNQNLQETY